MGIAVLVDQTGSPAVGLSFLIVVSALGLIAVPGLRRVLPGPNPQPAPATPSTSTT